MLKKRKIANLRRESRLSADRQGSGSQPLETSRSKQEPMGIEGAIEGDLTVVTPFELLQIFGGLRRSGTLSLRQSGDLAASCLFVEGSIAAAECGHLRDSEAVCTLIWWKDGVFRFEPDQELSKASSGSRPEALLLEAVRVADELERRAAQLPGLEVPLRLRSRPLPTTDPLDCGLFWVCEFIRRNPGTCRAEIERSLSLAPAKIRLALTLAVEEGRLEGYSPENQEPLGETDSEDLPPGLWARAVARFGRTIRIVVGYSPRLIEELSNAVSEVIEALDLPRQRLAISVSHPSFLRVRPPGGVISLTILPATGRNRFIFEALAEKAEVVVLAADGKGSTEASSWSEAVPEESFFLALDAEDLSNPESGTRLRSLLEAAE